MTLNVKQASQFKINELVIVTKAGKIDITGIFEELNIFDSLYMPVMSGNIVIKDSVGLSGKLFFDGSESILIDISKDENSDIAKFKKAFRIYKQANRQNDNQSSETYVLNFVSDELLYSDQQRITQSYNSTYSKIVERILLDYLKIPENNLGGVYDNTLGIKKIVVPNLRPLEAIEWCAKRSVDSQGSPNFVFFQNLVGYNFASLSRLLTQQEILDIKFEIKNKTDSNAIEEISSARSFEVVSQNDSIKRTRSGVNSGKFVGFDPMTRTVATRNLNYGDHYLNMKHGNENPNFSTLTNRDNQEAVQSYDSKKTVSIFGAARKFSEYIKARDPNSITTQDNKEDYVFQRKALFENMNSKKLKIVMPGNFQLTSGFNVNVMAPNFAKKEKGDSNEDLSVSGKYIIVASRQVIGYDKHETIIEVATTSSSNDFVPADNPAQTKEILTY
jgi:hypothetical protein